jgi:hypothetical protein
VADKEQAPRIVARKYGRRGEQKERVSDHFAKIPDMGGDHPAKVASGAEGPSHLPGALCRTSQGMILTA